MKGFDSVEIIFKSDARVNVRKKIKKSRKYFMKK